MTNAAAYPSTEIDGSPLTAEEINETEGNADLFSLALPDSVDERQLLDALYDDLERGEYAKAVMAEAEMRTIAEFQNNIEHRTVDGLGQLIARVPLDTYLHWAGRYGADFWQQEDSIDFFARRNAGFTPVTKAKPTIIVDRKVTNNNASNRAGEGGREVASSPARSRGGRWAL